MGNFYTSFTVRGADRGLIAEAMKGKVAAISPTYHEYTLIWPAESEKQDQQLIDRLGLFLSLKLACPVFAVLNHDDDILWYGLYTPEGKLDEYNSAPGYFDGDNRPPSGGDPALLENVMAPNASQELIRKVLHDGEYVFASERHSALLEALGMPSFAACVGYEYIANGEMPIGLMQGDLTFTE